MICRGSDFHGMYSRLSTTTFYDDGQSTTLNLVHIFTHITHIDNLMSIMVWSALTLNPTRIIDLMIIVLSSIPMSSRAFLNKTLGELLLSSKTYFIKQLLMVDYSQFHRDVGHNILKNRCLSPCYPISYTILDELLWGQLLWTYFLELYSLLQNMLVHKNLNHQKLRSLP